MTARNLFDRIASGQPLQLPRPATLLLGSIAASLASCDGDKLAPGSTQIEVPHPSPSGKTVEAAKGIFHTRSRCPRKIKVSPPFSVIEDSWGTLGIWARLEALDDVKADVLSKEESYVFQQRAFYFTQEPVGGSGGVWRKIEAHTTGNLRGTAWRIEPANALPGDFRAWETRTVVGGRTWPSEYYYLSSDAKIAIYCSPKLYPGGELVPSPYCYADVKDDSGRFLFNARFPIHASDQLMDIVQAGRRLFAPATDVCSNNSMESGSRNIQDDAMLAETASR